MNRSKHSLWALIGYLTFTFFGKNLHAETLDLSLPEMKKAYPGWCQLFKNNLLEFSKEIKKSKDPLSEDKIDSIFKNSIEAKSKMTLALSSFQRELHSSVNTEPGFIPAVVLLLSLFEEGKPVSLGGISPLSQGVVVYMNLENTLQELKKQGPLSEQLNFQEQPPQDGKLHRGIYPFLVFKRIDGKVVLSSISKEMLEVLKFIHARQFE